MFFLSKDKVQEKVDQFLDDENTLIFGLGYFSSIWIFGAVLNPCVEKIRCFNQEIFQACCWNKGICCCSLKQLQLLCTCTVIPKCAWIEAWHFSGMDWQNENMMWKYTGGIWKNHLGWNVANFYSRHVPKILQVVNDHFQFYCINIRESQKPLK